MPSPPGRTGAILARMRRHGAVESASGLGLHGHACWTFGDETEFRAGVFDFLVDGLELGQRLLYVGPGGVGKLRSDVADVPGIVTARRSNGFYLQDPEPDADPATSEGIFVFTSTAPPAGPAGGSKVGAATTCVSIHATRSRT